jgi:hypothetical protein
MSASRARVTAGKASLIGGITVGIAGMLLWLAVTRELGLAGPVWLGAGLLVSVSVAVWIRLADL